VRDGIPECLRRLPGKKAARPVGDRARDQDRHTRRASGELLGDSEDRGLGVERVENGLDQKRVDPAVEQSSRLFGIGDAQRVEGDGAKAGIGYIGRDRRGAVGRSDRAGDKTLAAVLISRDAGRFARQSRPFGIELIGHVRHAVVRLRDAGR